MTSNSRPALSHTTQNLLNSYNKRLQDDVRAMHENFTEIIKSAKIEETLQVERATQTYYDMYQMRVRAANIVRAGESLLKLISELKTFVILNDFPSVNHHVDEQNKLLNGHTKQQHEQLIKLRDEIAVSLFDLESDFYNSSKPQVIK